MCFRCFASKTPSEREFFDPARTDLAVKLLRLKLHKTQKHHLLRSILWDVIYNFLLEYGTSAYVIIRVYTLLFALLICIHFQIAVVIPHYF